MKIKRNHIILVVGLIVSLAAIWYSTRNVDWSDFVMAFRKFELIWLIPGLATFYYSMYLRAVRWAWLFRPNHDFKGHEVWPPIMICFGFNSILPGRVGEFARAIFVGRRMKTGVSMAMATVATERLLDGVILLAMLAICLGVLPPLPPDQTTAVFGYSVSTAKLNEAINSLILISAVLTVGVILFMIPAVQRLAVRVTRAIPGIPHAITEKIVEIIEHFARGFHALRSPKRLAVILFQTIVIWLLVGLSDLVIAYGFDMEMNFLQAQAIVVMIGIFIIIPAAPGYWGLYEAGAIFSLLVLGVTQDASLALAYGLLTHLLQWLPVVFIGLYYAAKTHVKPPHEPEEIEELEQEGEPGSGAPG